MKTEIIKIEINKERKRNKKNIKGKVEKEKNNKGKEI
jgi:hypothetical protein